MSKKLPVILASIMLFFAIAFVLDFFSNQKGNLEKYGEKINAHLQQREAEAFSLLSDSAIIKAIFSNQTQLSEKIFRKDFSILVYHNDTLIFWNNTETSFTPDHFPKDTLSPLFQSSTNGDYALYLHPFPGSPGKKAVIAIPLKRYYPVQSPFLKDYIPALNPIANDIQFSDQSGDFPIQTRSGKAICYLKTTISLEAKKYQRLILIFYLLGFVALCFLINLFTRFLTRRYHSWAGAIFLFCAVGMLRFLTGFTIVASKFPDLGLVTQTLSTPVYNSSLGDLLINSLILLWLASFFHREFRVRAALNRSILFKIILSLLFYFSILMGLISIIRLVKILVLDSGVVFDFNNIFNQDLASFLTILSIQLLLICFFLFSHRMILSILQIGLHLNHRLIAITLAIFICLPIVYFANLQFSILPFILVSTIYLSLFDLFVERPSPGLTWVVVWIFLLAAFITSLLFKYNLHKDLQTKLEYTSVLAERKDTITENYLIQLIKNLKGSAFSEDDISKFFNGQPYLFNNYHYELIQPERDSSTILEWWEKAPEKPHQNLKLMDQSAAPYLYLAKIGQDSLLGVTFLGIGYKNDENAILYAELLENTPLKGLENLHEFDFAIYDGSRQLIKKGSPPLDLLNTDFKLAEGQSITTKSRLNKTPDVLYRGTGNTYIIITKSLEDSVKPLSLFSYQFTIFLLLVAILFSLNLLLKAIPQTFEFPFIGKPSLRNKIQLAVLALTLGSFLIIGLVTVAFFQRSSIEYHQNRLSRKINAVVEDVEHEFSLLPRSNIPETQLKKMAAPVSRIHNMDVNLFDLDGKLISTSAPFLFNQGIIAPRLNPRIRQILKPEQQRHFITREQIGTFDFQVAYVNIFDPEGKTIAFLGLPYYSNNRNLRSDVFDFIGTLLNVYVFLLLGAGAIAIAVANSITQPISKIGEKLSLFKLGNNEPLEWKSQDEIGELIREYNQMIEKLDESTEKLKVSEREGAWREMAKQVAHEIKNPLTPMKLSIQYLMHAYRSNKEDIEPLLKRVSNTLIEQIEGLSRIASEFSNFAKMPKAQNEVFVLNELVESVYNLYKEGSEQEDSIVLQLPESHYPVFADKGHINRVITNLIKNALQAIPDGRPPKIIVSLAAKDQKAIICVSDNGTGISEDMQEKVFYPNFTTKTSGMGLGLAISKSIIESVEGKIYFKTVIDQGTDFFIELPIIEPDNSQQ